MIDLIIRAMLRLCILWGTAGIAAASPLSATDYFGTHFYGNNGVCLSLHIHDPYAKVKNILFYFFFINFFLFIFYVKIGLGIFCINVYIGEYNVITIYSCFIFTNVTSDTWFW